MNKALNEAVYGPFRFIEWDIILASIHSLFKWSIQPSNASYSSPTKISSLEQEVTSQNAKVSSLQDRVEGLTCSLNAYKILRNRFIQTKQVRHRDCRVISDGNNWAHGGDASVDAQLYTELSGRRDFNAFEKPELGKLSWDAALFLRSEKEEKREVHSHGIVFLQLNDYDINPEHEI
jgi:hypothetical protein